MQHHTSAIPFPQHSALLATLLDTIVQEAHLHKPHSDPDALAQYLDLTGIIADLLDEAQMYGFMSRAELDGRRAQVEGYLSRVEAVERVACGGVDVRARGRKRGRGLRDGGDEDGGDDGEEGRRRRRRMVDDGDDSHGMVMGDGFADRFEMEREVPMGVNHQQQQQSSATTWWMEPFYD